MREINKIAESLFEKVRDRFEDVSIGDEEANATQNPENARFFNFDYIIDGKNYGNITLSIVDEVSLKVYFSKNISNNLDDAERRTWYSFLKELREFAKRNLLSFEPRDITRSTLKHRDIQQVSKADSTYTKDEVIGEGRMYGTSRSSYENSGPVRIIVRHSDYVDPEQRGARSRKIKSIFVETSEGERIKLPHNNLRYARAMARHVSEGGQLMDDFGQHITRIAEECGKLRPFKNAVRRRTFEDAETQAMVEAAFEYHSLLNNTLKRMGGRKGYDRCKESFQANEETLMDDFDVDSMRERFVRKTYNDATDQALPIVQKAYKMKKQNKFAQQFESWANNVAEEWEGSDDAQSIDIDDLADLVAEELPIGVDAINAITAISGIISSDELEDKLTQAAQENPEADARDVIMDWIYNNEPNVYQELMNEIGDVDTADQYGSADSGMDGQVSEDYDAYADEDQIESIQSAIIRRILGNVGQHSELLKKAGPDGVMNAARDVASFHAPVEELGSSDISAMVREVYNEVGVEFPEMNEADSAPLRKTASPSKKAKDAKYYDYLARTLGEGRMKEVAMDIEELSNKQFYAKYKMSKDAMKAKLAEGVGDDYVNKKEKLAKAGAHRAPKQPEQSFMDKVKSTAKGAKAWVQGKDDSMYESDDDERKLERYHELIKQGMDPDDAEVEVFNNEGDEHSLSEMRRLAGLK
jgi:hypothetical protein